MSAPRPPQLWLMINTTYKYLYELLHSHKSSVLTSLYLLLLSRAKFMFCGRNQFMTQLFWAFFFAQRKQCNAFRSYNSRMAEQMSVATGA